MQNQQKIIIVSIVAVTSVLAYLILPGVNPNPGNLSDDERILTASPPAAAKTDADSIAEPARQPIMLQRQPLQVMENPYPDLSGVAVDPVRGEIILVTGQRAAQIMVFDRAADTPDYEEAIPHEPKRMISGSRTKIGAPGLYVDPAKGEIYSVDTTHGMLAGSGDRMVVFSTTSEGNVAPVRELLIPHRGFAIDADEQAGELFITVQHPPAVVVYSKTAKDNEAPLRLLEGPSTRLTDVHGIALDSKRRLMFVANRGSWSALMEDREWSTTPVQEDAGKKTWDIPTTIEKYTQPGSGEFRAASITIYPMDADGDMAPIRTIQGENTQLGWPAFIALDEERDELYVANSWPHSILVFRASDSGDAAPLRVIKGEDTGLDNPYGIALDKKSGEIIVANYGNHTATVYAQSADGNVPPLRTIRLAPEGVQVPIFQHLSALDYDSKRGEVLVQSCIAQPQMVSFSWQGTKIDEQFSRILAGQNTLQGRALHDMRYDAIHDEIVFANPNGQALLTFSGGADGNEAPLRVIQGPSTGLIKSDFIEVDPVHDELFVPDEGKIMVFPRTGVGDVAPIRTLQGPDTGLDSLGGGFLSVDPSRDLLVVPNKGRFLIFDRTASGNTKPRAIIESPYIKGVLHLRVYPPTGAIVATLGGKSNGAGQDEMTAIAVWNINDSGNVPPRYILTDITGTVAGRKLAFNPEAKELIVGGGITLRRYAFPEIYE